MSNGKVRVVIWIFYLLAAACLGCSLPDRAEALVLTASSVAATDGTGQANTTFGPAVQRGIYGLWVAKPSGPPAQFLNSAANPNINFSLYPGTYEYYLFGSIDPNHVPTAWELELFFDSGTAPQIAAAVPTNSSSFSVYSGSVWNLQSSSLISSPDSLSYTADGLSVSLTNLYYGDELGSYGSTPKSIDQVSPFAPTPDGVFDFAGSFTMTVTAVPEPSSLYLLLPAFAAVFAAVRTSPRCHKRRSAPSQKPPPDFSGDATVSSASNQLSALFRKFGDVFSSHSTWHANRSLSKGIGGAATQSVRGQARSVERVPIAFQTRYQRTAQPLRWAFTRRDLHTLFGKPTRVQEYRFNTVLKYVTEIANRSAKIPELRPES